MKKIAIILIITLFFNSLLFANNQQFQLPVINSLSFKSNNSSTQKTYDNHITLKSDTYISPYNKEKYLTIVTLGSISLMLVGAGILYTMPESVTNWDKKEINNIFSNWWSNVKSEPIVDKDNWFINYITHPYWGAIYYMQARTAGYDRVPSFLYSTFLSTFLWEYGVESFAEVPSIQDLIITPVVGSLIGELFFITSTKLKNQIEPNSSKNYFIYPLLTFMDPGWILIEHSFLRNWVINDTAPQPTIVTNTNKIIFSLSFKLKPLVL